MYPSTRTLFFSLRFDGAKRWWRLLLYSLFSLRAWWRGMTSTCSFSPQSCRSTTITYTYSISCLTNRGTNITVNIHRKGKKKKSFSVQLESVWKLVCGPVLLLQTRRLKRGGKKCVQLKMKGGIYTSTIHTMYILAAFLEFSANAALTDTGEALGE